jgi:hypothetical protein
MLKNVIIEQHVTPVIYKYVNNQNKDNTVKSQFKVPHI